MSKYCVTMLLVAGLAFSLGVRPAFDLGFNWTNVKFSSDYGSQSEDYTAVRVGTTVPYSRIIGLYVEIAAINMLDGGNEMYLGGGGMSGVVFGGIGTKLGIIEVIPSHTVSPFFKEFIMIDQLSDDYGYSLTFFSLGIGIGVEFLSNAHVSPIIEGGLSRGSQSSDGYSTTILSYGFSGGLRFSWK